MISLKKILKPLMEYSYAELAKMANDSESGRKRQIRSSGLITNYLGAIDKSKGGVDQGDDGQVRTFWKVESGTKSGKYYNCVIEFHIPGGLFSVAKDKKSMKEIHPILAAADVKVHCSCPDFYWSGMKYNLGSNGKYSGALSPKQNAGYDGEKDTVSIKPDKRDPNRVNVLCKHLLAIKKNIGFNVSSIMRDVRNYDKNAAKIKVDPDKTKQLDKGNVPLGKNIQYEDVDDSQLRSVSKQDASDMVESIIHTPVVDPAQQKETTDNAAEVITDESKPVDDENRTDNADEIIASDIIDAESDNETEFHEAPEDLIEQDTDTSQTKSEKGAGDIIDDKNKSVKNEEAPEEAEGVVLEKNKKNPNLPDPDAVFHV